MGSQVSDIIRNRRTVHSLQKEEVPFDILNQGLEHSLWAPNHRMTKPWCFLYLKTKARKQLAEIAIDLKKQKSEVTEVATSAMRTKYTEEGSLIVFAQKLNSDPDIAKEDYASVACSIQNFSLFMWEQGFGTKWSTGQIIRDKKTYKLLGLNPSEYEIVGLIWAGRFDAKTLRVQERGSLSEYFRIIEGPS